LTTHFNCTLQVAKLRQLWVAAANTTASIGAQAQDTSLCVYPFLCACSPCNAELGQQVAAGASTRAHTSTQTQGTYAMYPSLCALFPHTCGYSMPVHSLLILVAAPCLCTFSSYVWILHACALFAHTCGYPCLCTLHTWPPRLAERQDSAVASWLASSRAVLRVTRTPVGAAAVDGPASCCMQ
jgi:hypothetical protein